MTRIYYHKDIQKVEVLIDYPASDNKVTFESAYVVYENGVVTVYSSQNIPRRNPAQRVLVTSLVNTIIIFK